MTHRRGLSSAIALTFASIAACGGAPDGDGAAVAAIDTVNGVERLSYPEEPAPGLGWSADTVTVLGEAFAEDAYQFNNVSAEGLDADAEGNLYVLDRQGGRVLKYDRSGAHLATYGRQGEGPGELAQPVGMDVGPGDTIWVSDFTNRRLTGFAQDGSDPRTITFEENTGVPSQRMAALEDGFVLLFRPLFNFRRAAGGPLQMSRGGEEETGDGSDRLMLPVLRLSRSLEPLDTLWTSPEPPMDMVQLEAAGNIMITMTSREFYPDLQWATFSDGGVVVSDSAGYVLQLVDRTGAVRRVIRRGPAPRPATEADREAVRQALREESEEGGGVRIGGGGPDEAMQQRLLEQRLEKLTFSDLIPRIVTLRVDPADRIWVGVSESTPDEVERIDVYDRDGVLLGELRDFPMPDVFLGPDRFGVLRRDELDVQQVVILDVEGTEVARET
jgi:hypothetical protein